MLDQPETAVGAADGLVLIDAVEDAAGAGAGAGLSLELPLPLNRFEKKLPTPPSGPEEVEGGVLAAPLLLAT